MYTICVLGSSLAWTPNLVTDLLCRFEEPLEVRFIDIDPAPAKLCAEWGEAASRHFQRQDRFCATTDRRSALRGADAVLITLSTGGLDAMAHDLAIPERYGIYATVGDTAGPGGWSRSIRNIPVFRAFAEDFEAICPTAFIANYTNPLSALTATIQRGCGNPSVGLCHAYFETKDVIMKIFGLPDWGQISIAIAGMNHFTWVTEFKIGREAGYPLLREKIGGGSLRDALPKETADEIGIWSGHEFCVELFDAYGYLPYPADRHTSEFVGGVLTGNPARHEGKDAWGSGLPAEVLDYCNIRRTSIEHRYAHMSKRGPRIRDIISGKEAFNGPSRETGAHMIHSYLHNQPMVDAVNCLNTGQIPGLPLGACVETLGVVDGLGVRPMVVADAAPHLLELMRPQAVCTSWIVEGMLSGDRELLLQALYRDPQCAHLKPHEVRAMAGELFAANAEWTGLKA